MARAGTYIAWTAVSLLGLIALMALLALLPAVQTIGARYALRQINANISGRVSLERVHVTLGGRFSLRGFRLQDETGREVLTLDSLEGRLRVAALRRDSLHILDLRAQGLTLDLALDSSGSSNLQRALKSKAAPKPKSPSAPSPWTVRLDRIEITGKRTLLRGPHSLHFESNAWTLAASADFGHDSLRYNLHFESPGQVALGAVGSAVLGKEFHPLAGQITLTADSAFVRTLPPPANVSGTVTFNANYRMEADSLHLQGDFESSALGRGQLDATTPFPLKEIAGRAEIEFAEVTVSPFLPDPVITRFSGHARITKSADRSPLNGWSATLDLDDSRYGPYHLRRATLNAQTKDSTAALTGLLDTGRGTARVDAHLSGFDVKSARLRAHVETRSLDLHALLPQVPDTLSRVTGTLDLTANSLDTARLDGSISLTLAPLALGRFALDTLFLSAQVHGQTLTLDTLEARGMGAWLGITAEGTRGGDLHFRGQADVPDLAYVQSSLRRVLPPLDSLSGSVQARVEGSAGLAGDSLSHLVAAGFVQVDSFRMGQYSVAHAFLSADRADLDSLRLQGSLFARAVAAAGQQVDSVELRFDATPREIAANLGLWAKADTIALSADLSARISNHATDVILSRFAAAAYGIPWQSEGETALRLHDNRLEIDGLQLRSPVGVVRAAGALERGGEQDLVIELSGFRTGEIARVFKQRVPESRINARLQLTGPDTALTGDLSLTADSVVMDGSPLADEIVFHAAVTGTRTTVDGFLIWLGDTLTVFEGELPARISGQRGFVIADSLPIRGHVRLLSQPLSKLNRYLPFGTTLEGTISADVTFSGTPASPRWSGVFAVENGRYRDARYGVDYRDLAIQGELAADTLRIPRFNAKSEGTLTGSGWAVMAFPLPSEMHLDLTFDKFEAINGPMMRGRAGGHVTVNGPLRQLNADGRLELSDVLYRITQASSKQVEEIDLKAEIARLRGDTTQAPFLLSRFYRPMSHRLNISLPGNCWVRGGGVNLELQGSLWLYKDSGSPPTLNGEVTVREGGGVEFLGRELRVLSGSVRYEGPLDDPAVDIVAYLPRPPAGVDSITAHVYGTLLHTRIELRGRTSAGDEMTPDSVVMKLVASGMNLFQSDSVSVAGKMESVLTTAASSQLSGMVGRLAGLDVFEFRPGEGGLSNLAGGSLEIGTYVTNRLFVQVLQPIKTTQTGQKVSIEYRLFDWLKLRAQQTGRESSAFDLYLQFDWR
jgi:autotransporter translocation and assembly factor TamB